MLGIQVGSKRNSIEYFSDTCQLFIELTDLPAPIELEDLDTKLNKDTLFTEFE